jgi:hypothetical protein
MGAVETGAVLLVGYLAAGVAAEVLAARWRRKRHLARWTDVQRTLGELASDMRGQVFDEPVIRPGVHPYLGTLRRYGHARVTRRGLTATVGAYDAVAKADDHQTWIRIARPADRAWVCESLRLRSRPGPGADRGAEAVFRRCFAIRPLDAVLAGARIHLMELAAQASRIALEPQELLVVAAPGSRSLHRHVSDRLALRALVEQAVVAVELLTVRAPSGQRRAQLAIAKNVDTR